MLSVEANERLARVGPGTPCGELMRRYWVPIRPYAQLLEEEVLPVRILGEDLVLFRTTKGELGLVEPHCPHRQTGLQYGIPDEDGLRCCYHGWLIGPTGQCLDTPLEAADNTLKHRTKIKAYPAKEMGGLVWTYMGPEPAPLLTPWDPFVWPNALRQIGIANLDCNWLQCQENTGDPTHSVYLHGHLFKHVLEKQGDLDDRAFDKGVHRAFTSIRQGTGIESVWAHLSQRGFEKGVTYSKALGADKDGSRRHSDVVFPFFTRTGGPGQVRSEVQIRVPVDDTHTYHISYFVYAAPENVEIPKQDVVPWFEPPMYDERGKPILDYVLAHDMLAWWSQGELTDRSKEKLGRTDIPIILLRRQLDHQIAIVEDGGEPMNIFRDPAETGDLVQMAPEREATARSGGDGYRANFHKGYSIDDADRYGPDIELVKDLMRRVEESEGAPA